MRSSLPVWCFSSAAAAWLSAVVFVAACGDTAAVVTIESDLVSPEELSDFCVLVEDGDLSGGAYADRFRLSEKLALPQTLTVFPGEAQGGVARARGYLDGDEIARDEAVLNFSSGISEVVLALDACEPREAAIPSAVHTAVAPAGALLTVSYGRGGSVLLAVASGEAVVLAAQGGELAPLTGALPPVPASVSAVVAFDADGDCDDDIALATGDGLEIWLRDSIADFTAANIAGGGVALRDVSAADIDEDGDIDVIAGGGISLALYRNDGSGRFEVDTAAIDTGAEPLDVTALAIADISGDGHPDLIAGQGAENPAPVLAFANDTSGTGFFEPFAGALPPAPYLARDIAAIDSNVDGAAGLLVATSAGLRHFVNRGDGRLEDRSFVTLPPIEAGGVRSVAVGDFDDNCIADVAVGRDAGAPVFLRGTVTGELAPAAIETAAGEDAVISDIDDDGARDVVLAGGETGILWITR